MKNDFVFFENQTSATTGNALTNADGNLYIAIAGEFTGTVIVQGKQGENWFDINVIDLKEIENKKTIEAPGAFAVVAPEAFEAVRCNLTAISSGSVTATGILCY